MSGAAPRSPGRATIGLSPALGHIAALGRPSEPILLKSRLHLKLTVPAGKLERARFEIAYER